MVSFRTIASKHEYNAMTSFQTTANMFFMHRNEIGLLTLFAKINKRGGLKRSEGVEKNLKINKRSPFVLNTHGS